MVLASGPAYADLSVGKKLEDQLVQLHRDHVFNTPNPIGPSRTVRIRWKDQVLNSIAKASEANGISKTQVSRLAKDPTNTDWERLPGNGDDKSFSINSDKAKVLSIEGKRYRSIKEAGRQLNLSRRTISRRLADPVNYQDWKSFHNSMNGEIDNRSPEIPNKSAEDNG